MFSMLFQILRWIMTLALGAGVALGFLLVRVRWEGGGRFELGLKDHLGLEGTLVDARTPGPPTEAPDLARSSSRQLPGSERCAELRSELSRSVVAYLKKTRLPMNRLDIFALLEAEVLHDIPTCPRGGAFSQGPGGVIHCSLHGKD